MNIKIKSYQWKIIAVILSFLTIFMVSYSVGVREPNHYDSGNISSVEITINKGSSVEDISKILEENDLINSRAFFKLYVYINNKRLQAGNFFVPSNANIVDLVALLGKGSFQNKFTFLEGWRSEQMAQILPSNIRNEFMVSSYTKDGYMFPDTYLFAEDATGDEIAKVLRQTFDEKMGTISEDINKSELSLDEIVILASIVEREAKSVEDKAIIAGILIKRYNNGWPLQADATVQYAKDLSKTVCASVQECTWWEKVSASDLAIDSPYNTYKIEGLPPTPICNPGLDSIKAVLNYKETPYWFYITGNDGITHYSETVEEHNENIQKYL